jgi:hypothetical protein
MTTPVDSEPKDWSWLKDTYWYVLPENLPALQYDAAKNTLAWIVDQTVWHITDYRDGYFWGITSVLTRDAEEALPTHGRGSQPTGLALLGSITPEGRVHLTFVADAALTSRSATIGIGRAVPRDGSWSLEMQMSSGSRERTAHWAYMVRTQPGDPSWTSLPGIGLSVPEMLEGLEPPQLEQPLAST